MGVALRKKTCCDLVVVCHPKKQKDRGGASKIKYVLEGTTAMIVFTLRNKQSGLRIYEDFYTKSKCVTLQKQQRGGGASLTK